MIALADAIWKAQPEQSTVTAEKIVLGAMPVARATAAAPP
jgi:hypothetical protein